MYLKIKRMIDILGAIGLLFAAWPFMVIAAIAIKIESPKENVLFRQQRPGKNEKIFTIYKFRTMKTKIQVGEEGIEQSRITKIGKLLRDTSIDELPQLFNILKGDMSFIGPRPLLVEYLPHYNENQRKRHQVKPGISGWAQVNGRNAISWEEKFELDIWYVEHIGLGIDAQILYKTLVNVLKRKDINNSVEQTMPFFGNIV